MADSPSQSKPASVDSILAASRTIIPASLRGASEGRMFWTFVGVSIAVHTLVFFVSTLHWLRSPQPMKDEWAMDADVVSDLDAPMPNKTALPEAVIKAEAKVPVQLLPQLPEKFSVKEPTKADAAIAEVKAPEPPKELKVAEQPKPAEDLKIKTENSVDNQMDQAEILKRAALEKLRKNDKLAKTAEAPEKDQLAKIAEALDKNPNTAVATGGAAHGSFKSYGALVKTIVSRNYTVPEAYQLKGANLRVVFRITISERGDLMDLVVKQPSGDPVFDDLSMQAVRASVPLPKPPAGLAGEPFELSFTP